MRIVLTNAGQKEINDEINYEINKTNEAFNPRYNSLQKIRKKVILNQRRYKPNSINRFKQHKTINQNITNIQTEENHLNNILKNRNNFSKENSSIKIKNSLIISEDKNKNNYKLVQINNSKNYIPKEVKMLYYKQNNNTQIYDNKIDNLFEDLNKKSNNNNNNNKSKYDISLPLINNTVILKDLLQTKNTLNVNKNVLHKKINTEDKNLVNYLKLNKTIRPTLLEKVNKADDIKLVKLDKVCQKYFNNVKKVETMKRNIRNKIKLEYSNDSKFCQNSLLNMEKNIKDYKNIYQSLEDKKDEFYEKRALALYCIKK